MLTTASGINERDTVDYHDIDPAFEMAVRMAKAGVPVFPVRKPVNGYCTCPNGRECLVPGKHPHIRGWTNEATTNLDQLDRWHRQFPRCNWGGLTGKRAGRLIMETDPRAGGDDGLQELERELGPLPETQTYLSGTGGTHRVFAWPGDDIEIINSAGRLAIGVDVRGRGGMGILPGSRHKSDKLYEILNDVPPADLPGPWVARMKSDPERRTNSGYDGPEAQFEPVLAGCRFMQHAQDDAATLGEEDWWLAVTIAANTENGIEHAHELSAPYPGYLFDETQAKAARAIEQDSPPRCKTIEERTGGKWCQVCPHKGRITGPLTLGLPKPTIMRSWESAGNASESLSDTTTPPVSDRKFRFRTAKEIGETTPATPHWICRGLVAPGSITEIDGKAKSAGKTTFALTMLGCIFGGRAFLDLPTRWTKAVYLTEQSPTSYREPLRRAGLLSSEDLLVLCFADTKGAPWPDVAAGSVDEAIKAGAELLIVDTLPQFSGLKGDSENNAGSALEAVLPLQLAASRGLAVVVIRHDRKGGGSVGESGRGSSAYAGAVDIVLQLVRPEGMARPSIRQLNGLSRYDETPGTLVFEQTDEGYISHGSEKAVKTAETRESILEALPDEIDGALKTDELAKEADASRTATKNLLDQLEKEGLARCEGTGKSGNPYRWWSGKGLSVSLGDVVVTDTHPQSPGGAHR